MAFDDKRLTVAGGGKAFRFGHGQRDNSCLVEGWGVPENGFVWSEGKFAAVTLPNVSGPAEVSISLWGYAEGRLKAQEVLFFANGLFVGGYSISDSKVVTFPVAPGNGDVLKLNFYIPTAIAPAELGTSPDGRCLGVALAVIAVKSV